MKYLNPDIFILSGLYFRYLISLNNPIKKNKIISNTLIIIDISSKLFRNNLYLLLSLLIYLNRIRFYL